MSFGSALCYISSTIAIGIAFVDGIVLQHYDRGTFYCCLAIFLLILAKF